MTKIKLAIGLILLLFTFNIGNAQSPSFTLTGPKVVAIGEQFQITYEINKAGSNFQPPAFNDFVKLQGPSTGSNSSVSMINGQVQRISKYTFSYVLAGQKEGQFKIAPASIIVDGKKIQSNSLVIEVVKGQSGLRNNQNKNQGPTGVADDDVYVKIELSRSEVYMGEQIVASLKVYSRTNNIDFTDAHFPSFDGFYATEIEDTPKQLVRENVNNEVYYVGYFKKYILLPQRTGDIQIEPFTLSCRINVPNGYQRDFFGRTVQRYKTLAVNLDSKSRTIKVKSLPSTNANNFEGAVGSFSLKSEIDKTTAKTNEALSLKYTLSGYGNIKLIQAFSINFPTDFDAFDPKVKENIKVSENGTSGTKTFEYLLIPRYAGDFTIPGLTFTYFDPGTRTYKTIQTEDYSIHIDKGDEEQGGGFISKSSVGKKEIQYIGKDIRYIKNETDLKPISSYFYRSTAYWLILLILPVLLLISYLIFLSIQKSAKNQAKLRNKRSLQNALKQIKQMEKKMSEDRGKEFYEEMLEIIYSYLSHKLYINLSDLNRENLNQILKSKLENTVLIGQLNSLLDTCEFSRYAPGETMANQTDLIRDLKELINQLDKNIKK